MRHQRPDTVSGNASGPVVVVGCVKVKDVLARGDGDTIRPKLHQWAKIEPERGTDTTYVQLRHVHLISDVPNDQLVRCSGQVSIDAVNTTSFHNVAVVLRPQRPKDEEVLRTERKSHLVGISDADASSLVSPARPRDYRAIGGDECPLGTDLHGPRFAFKHRSHVLQGHTYQHRQQILFGRRAAAVGRTAPPPRLNQSLR
jgi:hypothetical protein